MKIIGSVVLPDPSSAKLGAEYCNPYVNLKANVGLVSSPLVDFALASGYKNVIVGGELAYDTAKSSLTKYNVGVGYHAPDHQAAVFLQDRATALRLSYAHNITPAQTVGGAALLISFVVVGVGGKGAGVAWRGLRTLLIAQIA